MNDNTNMKKSLIHIALIAFASFILGLLVQSILPVGDFCKGTLAVFFLLFLAATLLYAAWRTAGGGKALAWMMILAFILRMGLGILLAWGLPRFGYEEPPQQAGFVFQDAFIREMSAWELAQSGEPITNAFSEDYIADQYGGILAMNALIYRFFSPDAFRPVLIVILTSSAFAIGLPFVAGILGRLFGRKTALWGGWIFALYPEGILLGASQMREPFLILFFVILTWSAFQFMDRKRLKLAILLFVGSALCLFLFSFRVAIPLLVVNIVLIWVMESNRVKKPWVRRMIWIVFLGLILGFGWIYRDFLSEIIAWDVQLTMIASGRIQYELESIPSWLHLPFIALYGIFQPVLPAAVAAPAPLIWWGLGIFRALGWYILLPLLGYGFIRALSLSPSRKKRLLMVMIIFIWVWVIVASVRAGGDQWDNPRYRTIFLPWMAVIAGWAVSFAKEKQDRWLGKVFVIEGIFLGFFTEWYISRYYPGIPRLDFWLMISLIMILSLGVIIYGWLRDRSLTEDEDSL